MLTIDLNEVYSLSDFQRNAKQHIDRMKKKRSPLVLTVNGKAEMVGLDIASFQHLLELLDQLEASEGIKRGLASKQHGEGQTLADFDAEMRRKRKLAR